MKLKKGQNPSMDTSMVKKKSKKFDVSKYAAEMIPIKDRAPAVRDDQEANS